MRRFTDVVLFGALFLLDAVVWLILSVSGGIKAADPGRIAPMTVGTIIVIACPALLVATVMALARALTNTSPRGFYAWLLAGAAVGGVVAALANPVAANVGIEVGFGWMAWFFGVQALAYVVALLIAITGGIGQRASKEVRRAESEAAMREQGPVPTAGLEPEPPVSPGPVDEGHSVPPRTPTETTQTQDPQV